MENTERQQATEHPWLHSVDHEDHENPWCPLGGELNLVPQHQLHREESPVASPLPDKAEESPPPSPHSYDFLETLLGSCITAWFRNCTHLDRKNLQRVERMAEKVIGVTLPSISDIYTTRCILKATSIVKDATNPSRRLFSPPPSGRRYLTIRSVTTGLRNNFFPQAIRLLNAQGLIYLMTSVALLYAILHHCFVFI